MAQNPAEVKRDRSADYSKSIAAGFANNTNLAAQTGKPDHAAQLVDFFNAGATVENAVYTDHRGTQHTKPVPAGGHYPVEVPVATLQTSGANVSCEVYWWATRDHSIVS
jgi:hypothetical protein